MSKFETRPICERITGRWCHWVSTFAVTVMFCVVDHPRVSADEPATASAVDFAHEILPILKQHCVECHGGREAKGGFSINTRELLVDSGYVEIGEPNASYLVELITSDDPERQMPPPQKPRVSSAEQQRLQRWITAGLPWDDGVSFAAAFEPPLRPRRPELPPPVGDRMHPVDRVIDAYLLQQQIELPGKIDDATFLRRVSLDLVGLLPEPEALAAFLADPLPDKRERMIDQLLDNDIAYAEHWLTFFNDLLRNDYSGTGFITGGRRQISGWLYEALVTNKPFDVMARELIAPPTDASRGYIDGIRWRGEVSAGQTVEIQFAQSIAQSFLGINLKCASCHDSFIDRWTLDEAYGLAAIYSERPLDIHRCDKPIGRQATAKWLFPEIGQVDPQVSRDERLQQLAALMTHADNGRFTRTIVNRLWYKLMGRGIVHPLDAMQSEPWNADLLDELAVTFSDNRYDLKAVLRLIATSQAYQAPSVVQESQPGADFVYRGPVARRMTAEQFLDGVWQITGAAPHQFDAPVTRGRADGAAAGEVQLQAQWIWGDSAAEGRVPPAGERIALRRPFQLPDAVQRGGAVITCDNAFELYVNGRQVLRGDNWSQPQAIALHSLLKTGNNEITVIATNAGDRPNAAGLFFEARLVLQNGEEVVIASDTSWEFNPQPPSQHEGRIGKAAGEWKPATVVPALNVWTNAIQAVAPGQLAQVSSGNLPMIRASLMKNDFLMKALGRPLREQIVSMRPDELTTLEAINLSNGQQLADALHGGAQHLLDQAWDSPEALLDHVFRFALSRDPTEDERRNALEFLGDSPSVERVEDVLWSVFMLPEYFLVR